jgi:hypothetical protein
MSTESTLRIGSLEIPLSAQTPLMLTLVEIIQRQGAAIKSLEDRIHQLKGNTQRPKIEPSRLLKPPQNKSGQRGRKRPGSQ